MCPFSTGTAISAAVETPTSSTSAATELTITKRFRPWRPTRTSPARPEAASMPIIAPVAITVAKTASSQLGVEPRSTLSKITPRSNTSLNTSSDIPASSTMPTSESRRTVRSRSAPRPRVLATATNSSAAAAMAVSTCPLPSSPQNAAR